jgi:2-haloalkanoic acid dehalogenase type II
MQFDRVQALTFDVYGTLIDWETGIAQALAPWAARQGLVPTRRELLEAFAASESFRQQQNPTLRYPQVLELVFEDIANRFGANAGPADAEAFGESVSEWPAFPDSAEALRRLSRHFKLAVVSNVDRASFAGSQKKLGADFAVVVTAEDAGVYKPEPEPLQQAIDELSEQGVGLDAILHTAQSLFHDHAPAQHLGLRTCWIDRQNHAEGGDWGATLPPPETPAPDLRFRSMAEFADAVDAAFGVGGR